MSFTKGLAALIAGFALTLSACQKDATPTQAAASDATATPSKTYTVGMNAEFSPFESTDAAGNIIGFDVDLMNAMAKAGGFSVKYKNQTWDSILPSLKSGDNDVLMSAITITDERKQSLAFSEPYFEAQQVILVPKGQSIASVEDLKKMNKVGVVTGNTGDLVVQKILGATSTKIARFESLPLILKELETGGVDAVVSDSAAVAHYVKNNGDKGFVMIAAPDFDKEFYGIAVRHDDAVTLAIMNDALKKVRANGEYQQIYQRYFAQ